MSEIRGTATKDRATIGQSGTGATMRSTVLNPTDRVDPVDTAFAEYQIDEPPSKVAQRERPPAHSISSLFELLANKRAWDHSPSGAPKIDPKGVGAGVGADTGPGYKVYAVIQIVDRDGRLVELSRGAYLGRGDAHAEQQAIRGLLSGLALDASIVGGRMDVAVTQMPCDESRANCAVHLRQEAKKLGLNLFVYVPQRPSLRDPSRLASPSTSARGAMRTDRPPLQYVPVIIQPAPIPIVSPPIRGDALRASGNRPLTSASPRKKSDIRALVGGKNMVPVRTGGLSPRGTAIADGMILGLQAFQGFIERWTEPRERQRAQDALERYLPAIRATLESNPSWGVLIVVVYYRFKPRESPIASAAVFSHLELGYGETSEDARKMWERVPRVGVARHLTVESKQLMWLPRDEILDDQTRRP